MLPANPRQSPATTRRAHRSAIALIALCILVLGSSMLSGCGKRQALKLVVRPVTATLNVGQEATFTLWNNNTDSEEPAGRWYWTVTPMDQGATCESGRFVATEPGTYEVSVMRDEWDDSDQPLEVVDALVTVVAAPSETHYDNHNDQGVQNGGTPPSFDLIEEILVTEVETYHYNNAAGVPEAGEISLQAEDGTVYGPWAAEGRDGQGGAANAYWTATPNVELPPGEYTVLDSDPATWSQNSGTGGEGMVRIKVESQE